ncbi:MAG: YbbR-like domain-containing protein [Bacteroidia bacterium]|nr:YbbR-like domain-containing protein [Bacteroidia bacterium]
MSPKTTNSVPGSVVKPRMRLNRKVSVILLCLLISTIFWLLIALSHDYASQVTFPVRYMNLPMKKVVINDLPSRITLQLKTSGFRIISYDFQKEKQAIEVDVSSKLQNGIDVSGDILAISTRSFLADFSRQLGKDVNITGFSPDSIIFNFSDRITKRLAVRSRVHFDFEKQYDSTGSVRITPDSIDISGPPSIVNSLSWINTEPIWLTGINNSVNIQANLPENKLLEFSPRKVNISLPVEKFTEGKVDVPVHAIHVKSGFSLKTFPDIVSIRYQVALSRYNEVNPQLFDAVVDGDPLMIADAGKLPVQLVVKPGYIRSVLIEPEKVDYILHKR